ncbi:MAG: KOW motif-containing protein, partial [Victivallales bacterium]|nr:KOW motif-containing protein [Victivallales bacterium]
RSEKNRANGIDDGLDDILLPTAKIVSRSGGKDVVQEKKCYPGYVFVRARIYDEKDMIIPAHWLFIRDTKGVINFMGGEKPIELTAQEIADLTAKEEEKDKPKPEKTWKVGDVVIVKEGPFGGFEGIIENVDNEKHRLKVSVQIFGRSVPCETDFWQVDLPEEPRN